MHFPKATRRKIVYATTVAIVSGSCLLVWKQLPKGPLDALNNGAAPTALTQSAMTESAKLNPGQKAPVADTGKPEETAAKPQREKIETYVVQEGDTISGIAAKYNLKSETILGANGDDEDIHPGQELSIPREDGAVVEIEPGDTLWQLAQDFGVTELEIAEANKDVDPGAIQPGMKLLIPGGEPTRRGRQVVSRSGSGRTRKLQWPTVGPLTDDFGWRVHPVYGTEAFHDGMDIGVGSGTPLVAAAGGTVVMASRYGGYGLVVRIDHGNGLMTEYAHLSQIDVSVGEEVSAGEHIGYSGNTGVSTGPHLHFMVLLWGEPVNPLDYLP
ncbi:MAG TPA: peptidoglycan DD-metalloendopeptidase family protein [Symbiobacteriaceae bacterium]|nr:peptidoglycan DD-metalloendopeptidase family protein [Symbiobacteriaceae bacterium]